MKRIASTSVILIFLSIALGAQTPGGIDTRKVYLFRALDTWSLDLSIAVAMLKDPYPNVRMQAAGVLASNPDPEKLRLIQLYASDSDERVRHRAMLAAGRLGPAGLNVALQGVTDRSTFVRQAAVWALCHGGPDAFKALSQAISKERDVAVLETLLANLWRLEDAAWIPLVTPYAEHKDAYLRRAAAYSLSRSGAPAARASQRTMAGDAEPVIRATVLRGLARGSLTASDMTVLTKAIDDADWRVRAAAYGALAAHEDVELSSAAGGNIVADFSAKEPHVAAAALAAAKKHQKIGKLSDVQAVVNGDDPWLAAEALAVLAVRNRETAKKLAAEWSASDQIWRQRAVARAAADLGAEFEKAAASAADAGVRLAWLGALDEEKTSQRTKQLLDLLSVDPGFGCSRTDPQPPPGCRCGPGHRKADRASHLTGKRI